MKKGIYLLPTLLTLGNVSFGMLSIISSSTDLYSRAAWMIIVCIVIDMIDGKVARWTNTQSLFGIQIDSIADIISFGVAPSFMMYKIALARLNTPGIAIALFYVIATAIRLARFNVSASEEFSRPALHFEGLPSPAAAGILASFVLSYELFEAGHEITVKIIPLVEKRMPFFFKTIPITMILVSLMMLSKIYYPGFKKFKFERAQSVQILALVVVAILLIVSYPQNTIFLIFLIYFLIGIIGYIVRMIRLKHYARKYGGDKNL